MIYAEMMSDTWPSHELCTKVATLIWFVRRYLQYVPKFVLAVWDNTKRNVLTVCKGKWKIVRASEFQWLLALLGKWVKKLMSSPAFYKPPAHRGRECVGGSIGARCSWCQTSLIGIAKGLKDYSNKVVLEVFRRKCIENHHCLYQ